MATRGANPIQRKARKVIAGVDDVTQRLLATIIHVEAEGDVPVARSFLRDLEVLQRVAEALVLPRRAE